MRLIEGTVMPDADPELDRLRADIRALTRQLADAKIEAKRAREDADRALSALRRQLNPLYRALQAVFGELDAVGIADAPVSSGEGVIAGASTLDPRVKAVWENWKDKLGAGAAKCIDALLLHGDMNTQQLSIATGYHRNTVPQYVSQLNKAGLINKNGGRFSLKAL